MTEQEMKFLPQTYYIITSKDEYNPDEFHEYKDGLNIFEKVDFYTYQPHELNGLSFTTIEHIHNFYNYGYWLREVKIPEDVTPIQDPDKNVIKYRASKIFLGKKMPLFEIETLKWIRENGGHFGNIADWAAFHGHLETLKWIREKGGDWTHLAADLSAGKGYLETLKWIRENGGKWTYRAANEASSQGHFETLKWIHENGGKWTTDAVDYSPSIEIMKYICENGGEWTFRAVDNATRNGYLEMVKWFYEKGGNASKHSIEIAAENGHTDVVNYIKSQESLCNRLFKY